MHTRVRVNHVCQDFLSQESRIIQGIIFFMSLMLLLIADQF